MTETKKVYLAITAVMADLAKDGIAKASKNQQQGYNFRGIDQVYNALSPILSRHNLCMLPRILAREVVERTTAKGNALFYVTVEAEFDLVCAEDGSMHTIRTFGEAMDSADKATNKAMSAAYKYAAMQAFAIPTEGDNDADAATHEIVASDTPSEPLPNQTAKLYFNLIQTELKAAVTIKQLQNSWERHMSVIAMMAALTREDLEEIYRDIEGHLKDADGDIRGQGRDAIEAILRAAISLDDLRAKWMASGEALSRLGNNDKIALSKVKDEMKALIEKQGGTLPNFDDLPHATKVAATP